MKIPQKSKDKKEKAKKKVKTKPKKEQVLIVAQEIKFARLLSGNEKKTRDRVLKALKKWLLNCFEKQYEFKEDDFVRVWKGLFYAVWMSDKPLIQEELCENISSVLDLFPAEHLKHGILMFKAGLRTLASEWYGIDQHRMDKFLMLVRRYLRASLRALARSNWELRACTLYSKMLSSNDGILAPKTPHYARNATSMILHIFDCYLEEISKVSNGSIPASSLAELLRPVCEYTCAGAVPGLCLGARRVLTALVRQSEAGIQYQHATQAWKQMGCPEGGPEALELVSDDDDDDDDEKENGDEYSDGDDEDNGPRPLDPRAGRVDVELVPLEVPAGPLAEMLRELLTKASGKAHKRVRICLQRFEQLAKNQYPLPVQIPCEEDPAPPVKQKTSVKSLNLLEKKLVAASDELALRGLSRKHRKRLLARARAGHSIVELAPAHTRAHTQHTLDDIPAQDSSSPATNGEWQVETTEPSPKKQKADTSNKENKSKKRKNSAKVDTNSKKPKVEANGDVKTKTKIEKKLVVIRKKLDNINKPKLVENGKPKTDKVNKPKVEKNVKNKTQKKKQNEVATDKVLKEKKEQKSPEKLVLKQNAKKTEKVLQKKNDNVQKQSPNKKDSPKQPTLVVNKIKSFQKQTKKINKSEKKQLDSTPKKVKFVLKNNGMQGTVDYYKSVRQSPKIPFEPSKKPSKTNLKPSTPSPINPFFKKKMKLSFS